jgi:hypothetical protein
MGMWRALPAGSATLRGQGPIQWARTGTVPGGALDGSFRAVMKEVDVQPTREGWKLSPQTYEPDGGRTEHEALS